MTTIPLNAEMRADQKRKDWAKQELHQALAILITKSLIASAEFYNYRAYGVPASSAVKPGN